MNYIAKNNITSKIIFCLLLPMCYTLHSMHSSKPTTDLAKKYIAFQLEGDPKGLSYLCPKELAGESLAYVRGAMQCSKENQITQDDDSTQSPRIFEISLDTQEEFKIKPRHLLQLCYITQSEQLYDCFLENAHDVIPLVKLINYLNVPPERPFSCSDDKVTSFAIQEKIYTFATIHGFVSELYNNMYSPSSPLWHTVTTTYDREAKKTALKKWQKNDPNKIAFDELVKYQITYDNLPNEAAPIKPTQPKYPDTVEANLPNRQIYFNNNNNVEEVLNSRILKITNDLESLEKQVKLTRTFLINTKEYAEAMKQYIKEEAQWKSKQEIIRKRVASIHNLTPQNYEKFKKRYGNVFSGISITKTHAPLLAQIFYLLDYNGALDYSNNNYLTTLEPVDLCEKRNYNFENCGITSISSDQAYLKPKCCIDLCNNPLDNGTLDTLRHNAHYKKEDNKTKNTTCIIYEKNWLRKSVFALEVILGPCFTLSAYGLWSASSWIDQIASLNIITPCLSLCSGVGALGVGILSPFALAISAGSISDILKRYYMNEKPIDSYRRPFDYTTIHYTETEAKKDNDNTQKVSKPYFYTKTKCGWLSNASQE